MVTRNARLFWPLMSPNSPPNVQHIYSDHRACRRKAVRLGEGQGSLTELQNAFGHSYSSDISLLHVAYQVVCKDINTYQTLSSASGQLWIFLSLPLATFELAQYANASMSDPVIYTIGWICAIGTELVAATSFLDEEHGDLEHAPVHDNNSYILGRIGRHNVVIAAPGGQHGLVPAAHIGRDMLRTFPNIRTRLMVGIGGGAPSPKHDIRLGDVVVSTPGDGSGGVHQYDYGRAVQDSMFAATGHQNQPPQFMSTVVNLLKARYEQRGHEIEKAIENVLASNTRLRNFQRPDLSRDRLYNSAYTHAGTKDQDCTVLCDASQLTRSLDPFEERDNPTIHYGIIASANQLMRDANLRDRISRENDVLCFEMEAAGLMNDFPCLVIRGICDYSDTHKNKIWQGYAAMAAAAYAKDLLLRLTPNQVEAGTSDPSLARVKGSE